MDIDFSKEFQHSVFEEDRKQDFLFSHKIKKNILVDNFLSCDLASVLVKSNMLLNITFPIV